MLWMTGRLRDGVLWANTFNRLDPACPFGGCTEGGSGSEQYVGELSALRASRPGREVDAAIDRWVWYAGWADKVHHVMGTVNPVAGPYFNFTFPEPTGVVGIVAPEEPALLGLVSRLAPVVVSGNCAVVLASEAKPLPAVTLGEVLATSDVPGGVIDVLTGFKKELIPWLASHMDVN